MAELRPKCEAHPCDIMDKPFPEVNLEPVITDGPLPSTSGTNPSIEPHMQTITASDDSDVESVQSYTMTIDLDLADWNNETEGGLASSVDIAIQQGASPKCMYNIYIYIVLVSF